MWIKFSSSLDQRPLLRFCRKFETDLTKFFSDCLPIYQNCIGEGQENFKRLSFLSWILTGKSELVGAGKHDQKPRPSKSASVNTSQMSGLPCSVFGFLSRDGDQCRLESKDAVSPPFHKEIHILSEFWTQKSLSKFSYSGNVGFRMWVVGFLIKRHQIKGRMYNI